MDALFLARLQFAATTVYHFFFVPLTLGLSIIVAVMETLYVRTGDETYKRMTKFWGKLFLINFAMGVVTGIVQEFQFGMNWSEYSRFVGDIFGAPLAIEALLAFFLESTFLGVWIFGWDRLSKFQHAAAMWIVAIGSNLSALWILIANSFMQEPVGFVLRNGRAEMTDFFALVLNKHVWVQFPHVFFSALCTAAFFVIGISAWHLLKKSNDQTAWQRSLKTGIIFGAIGIIFVLYGGHTQAQHMVQAQPMKMAAAEALWDSADPADLSLFAIVDEANRKNSFALQIPGLLSLLSYNRFSGEVKGINDVQKEYEAKYGPGNYQPPVGISFWTFRIMVGAGTLMFLILLYLFIAMIRKRPVTRPLYLKILIWAIALPYIANTAGWLFTEIARQPWVVFGVMRIEKAVSIAVSSGEVLFSLIVFCLLYGALMVADVYLLKKYATAGIPAAAHQE